MYNVDAKCGAKAIQVSSMEQETYCDTYTKEDSLISGIAEWRDADDTEFGDFGAPKIVCNVSECAYNKSFHCRARGIEIDDPHDSTICNCRTYRPK